MHPRERSDDFKMAELFRSDVQEQIFAVGIVAVQPLHGILHRRGKLAVCAAKLFEQHPPELGIGRADPDRVHREALAGS